MRTIGLTKVKAALDALGLDYESSDIVSVSMDPESVRVRRVLRNGDELFSEYAVVRDTPERPA